MTKSKLRRLKQQLERLRARPANIRSAELKTFARQLGRTLRPQQTGEPPYVSQLLPYSRPISIPDHPGSMNRYTAGNILDSFEADIFALEEQLEKGDDS